MKKIILILVLFVLLKHSITPSLAQQDDPVTQCVEGVELFIAGDPNTAYPLLEAGFNSRGMFTHSNQTDLGYCSFVLGILRNNSGNRDGALEAYSVSLGIFRQIGQRKLEGNILNNIATIYDIQGHYEEALATFDEALAISREVGNRIGEGATLNNIAAVYKDQGRYELALTTYEAALAIRREVGDQEGEGTTLNNIGAVYYSRGQYEAALISFEAALAIRREIGHWAGIGTALNNIGEVYRVQGRYEAALTTFEEALTIRREVGDRAGTGTTLNNIALVYEFQGRYLEALTFYEEALSIAREVSDRVGEGTALNNIAAVYHSQGRYELALNIYEAALTITREMGDRASEGTTLNNIAAVYHSQGRYELALTIYEEALIIHHEGGYWSEAGATLSSIAGIYSAQGQYEVALTAFDEALAIHREVGNRPGVSDTLNGTALVYHFQGRYESALTTFEEALAIRREVGDQAGVGATLNNIASVYHSQGRYEEALTRFEEALAIRRQVGDRAGTGDTLNGIALVYHIQGRYATALTTYEEALAIYREVGDRPGEGTTLSNIASVYDVQGQAKMALTTYEAALAIIRKVGDPAGEGGILNNIAGVYYSQGQIEAALTTFEEALTIRREVSDRIGEGTTLNNIGWIYQAQGQNLEAIAHYEQAVAIFDSIRAVTGKDAARASFFAQYASLYHRLLDVYMKEGRFTEAFLTSERGRARSFGDALATGVVQLADNEASAPLIASTNEAYATLIAAQDAFARARALNPPNPDLVADLEAQRTMAQTKYDEALAALDALDEALLALVPSRLVVSDLLEVQGLLNEQTTLVSFWMLEDQTIAFLVKSDDFDVVPIDVTKTELNTQVLAFHNFPETESTHPTTSIALYNTLIAPIQPYLNTRHLAFIPHQALHYIPFAALTDGETYMIDEYTITYLPSASMLPYLPEGGAAPSYDTALIIGNPDAAIIDDFDNPLSPLPSAEDTAIAVAKMFNTNPLVGAAAGETAVYEGVADANILHLGAHASFNTVAPLQSAVYLTPGEVRTVHDDGKLHVDEVYNLPMDNMELIVLSACQTNVGNLNVEGNNVSNITAGDELVSLNRAFLFQSPTVISTLWTVDDTATGLLIEQFYTHLLNGRSKADALRLAQTYVRNYNDGEYANPYYWAGFLLSGDGGEVEVSALTTDQVGTVTTVSIKPTNSASNGICVGSVILLSFVALFMGRRKKFSNEGK